MKDKYQDRISSGACKVAWCLSEKNCGSDPAAVAMEAKIADDSEHYILKGVKTWVSNANNSQVGTWKHINDFAECTLKVFNYVVPFLILSFVLSI